MQDDADKEFQSFRRGPRIFRAVILLCFVVGGGYWLGTCVAEKRRVQQAKVLFQQQGKASVSLANLKNTVHFLAGMNPPRNLKHPKSLNKAADYIASKLKALGYKTSRQWFSVNGTKYQNVIALTGPAKGPRIVVGAHYDVAGHLPGADDNASGIAGLLELARLLKGKKLKHPLEFVAYSLEEPPSFGTQNMGSFIHAKSLSKQNIKVKAMLCLEMIGYFRDKPKTQRYPVPAMKLMYPNTGNFLAVVGNQKSAGLVNTVYGWMKGNPGMPVEKLVAPAALPGVDFSDHRNYWKFGYAAVMLTDTAFYRNPNYHKASDTPATLDFRRMAEVVRSTYFTLLQMATK